MTSSEICRLGWEANKPQKLTDGHAAGLASKLLDGGGILTQVGMF
jgi:hypothetical protein